MLELAHVGLGVALRVVLRQRRARAPSAKELGAATALLISAAHRRLGSHQLRVALEAVTGPAVQVDEAGPVAFEAKREDGRGTVV